MISGAAVDWSSKKQPVVALSTTMLSAIQEAVATYMAVNLLYHKTTSCQLLFVVVYISMEQPA